MSNQHTGKQYTKQDCLESIREAKKILGHSPKMSEYRELDLYPGTWTIINRFGTWNEAKEAAGLKQYFKREGPPDRLDISEDEWWNLNKGQRYRLKKRAKVAEYKISRGCHKCGYDQHPHALDFHHIDKDNKDFTIGYATPFKNFDELQEEMNKCDVICTNCHRELESKYNWD